MLTLNNIWPTSSFQPQNNLELFELYDPFLASEAGQRHGYMQATRYKLNPLTLSGKRGNIQTESQSWTANSGHHHRFI